MMKIKVDLTEKNKRDRRSSTDLVKNFWVLVKIREIVQDFQIFHVQREVLVETKIDLNRKSTVN